MNNARFGRSATTPLSPGGELTGTLGLLDPSATPTTTYTYEPFGRTSSTGSASLNSARFTGREDDGTGLYYYRARYYHPQLQRFISEDPIGFGGGDANLHAYVGNDPVNATDPSGNINPIVAACGFGAAQDALVYIALSGRKSTFSGAAMAAAEGCVGGLVGLGIGKLAFAVMPRVMAATRRAPRACSVGQSFSAETEVATERGPRRIDGIHVGDRVLAYDEETGETSYQLVTATWAHEDPVLVSVTVGGERIETTPEHPFSVVGRGWVKASELRPGDRIHRAFGGTGPVTSVIVARQPQVMYNLTVDTAHTFFVGDDEWLVHNTGGSSTALSGLEAEEIVSGRLGVPRNLGPGSVTLTGGSGPGGVRRPDLRPDITVPRFGTIDEVKDWVRLRTTRQLREMFAAAERLGVTLRIHTDGKLPTRGWLADMIRQRKILIERIRC